MKPNQKQKAGVWLDNNRALIITQTDGDDKNDYSITGKIKGAENFGSGSEHAMNNSRQGDTLKFFKSLAKQLSAFDEIMIFGPGKKQEEFQNHLAEDGQFKNKKITIETANQLTDPQMIARVRDHFASS